MTYNFFYIDIDTLKILVNNGIEFYILGQLNQNCIILVIDQEPMIWKFELEVMRSVPKNFPQRIVSAEEYGEYLTKAIIVWWRYPPDVESKLVRDAFCGRNLLEFTEYDQFVNSIP